MSDKTNVLLFGLSVLLLTACGGGTGSGDDGADPGVLEVPIAYIKKPIPTNNNGDPTQLDLREPRFFTEGGDVYIRDNSSVIANETNITSAITGGIGDAKGLNVSYDGKRILFSLRLFDDPNEDGTPAWNIYEYEFETGDLRQVITGLTAEGGDDLHPAYLPDGRIVFTSSRQRQSTEILSNEGRTPFSALDEDEDTIAMVLHVMSEDGDDIQQISFNQSHDLYPTVMANLFDGQILFSRWDNAGANSELNLYKTNPDGSDMELLYGAHSHDTGTNSSTVQYSAPREMPDGNIMVVTQPFTGTFGGGDIATINTDSFVDNQRPVWTLNGLTGPAEVSATINNITNDSSISPNGRYASAFPLWDGSNRILVSKSTCQVDVDGTIRPCIEPWFSDPAAVEVSPAYGIWIYDVGNQTEKVIVAAEQGMVMTEVVAMQARTTPGIVEDKKEIGDISVLWESDGVGVINIKSVYDIGNADFDGCFFDVCTDADGIESVNDLGDPANATADQRPARFVRFVKAVALPDVDDPTLENPPDLAATAFGPSRNLGMREIVGYAPVEPDGSVKVKVPANVPLGIEVLDKFARRIGPRHNNWFQVNPGDSMTCIGCHSHSTDGSEVPYAHYRSDASAPSVNSGLPAGTIFANTQIPGTIDAYYGNVGETMAEVLFNRVEQMDPAREEPELSIDVQYEDIWTDPGVRSVDVNFSYQYDIPSPANGHCSPWSWKCRSVINYESIIHPIWQVDRGTGVTCTECHSNVDAVAVSMVPDGQLDLTDGIDAITGRYKSYEELLFSDAGQELDVEGNLVNIQIEVDVLDEDGNVTGTEFIDDPEEVVLATMSVNGARSSYFIEKMTETELEAGKNLSTLISDSNYIDHSTFLSADELRLISEWIDLGVQYFNNPFDSAAPQN